MADSNVVFTSLNRRAPSFPLVPRTRIGSLKPSNFQSVKPRCRATASISSVVWDEGRWVIATDDDDDASKLEGYFQRVRMINRGWGIQSQFVPFMIEGHVVWHMHNRSGGG